MVFGKQWKNVRKQLFKIGLTKKSDSYVQSVRLIVSYYLKKYI